MQNSVLRPELYEVMAAAVVDGLAKIREVEANAERIFEYSRFPEMGYFPSGLPHFSAGFFGGSPRPKDYGSIFTADRIPPNSLPSWRKFWDFALADERLGSFWEIGDEGETFYHTNPEWLEIHRSSSIFGSIIGLIDRYIHVTGARELVEEQFKPVYAEWERSILLPELQIDVLVPILYLKFGFQDLELGSFVSIEEMNDEFQLARNADRWVLWSSYDTVVGAATHAFTLRRWTVKNETHRRRKEILSEEAAFLDVIQKADQLFAALRAETGVSTGYGQLVVRPIGWADSWKANLPSASTVRVKAYPERFENHGWLEEPRVLAEETCVAIGQLYDAFERIPDNSLALATRRLNAAFLRRNEDDTLVDVTIGLESLLASDGHQEIAYRLAMRSAALCRIEPFAGFTPSDVYDVCKKVYALRSDIVHGRRQPDRKKTINLEEKGQVPTVSMGIDLLRFVIRTLARHPQYLDPTEVDKYLLGSGNLGGAEEGDAQ